MVELDLSEDYLVWDNPETVTVEAVRRSPHPPSDDLFRPGATGPSVPTLWDPSHSEAEAALVAKRRALTRRELLASGGVYTAADMVWLVPAAEMVPGKDIKPGDAVRDQDGRRWTVLDLQLGKWRETWKLTCRDLILALGLRDMVDVQRAEISFDAAGAAVKTVPPDGGTTLYASLPARVQPTSEETADARGIRGEQVRYDVIVGRQVQINPAEDRVRWRGRTLDVVRLRAPELITELPVIECEARP
jgi:hypothetical protein